MMAAPAPLCCPVCLNEADEEALDMLKLECGHTFCVGCAEEYWSTGISTRNLPLQWSDALPGLIPRRHHLN